MSDYYGYTYKTCVDNPSSSFHECYYYGQHRGNTFDPNYFGSGRKIKDYIKKYGTKGLNVTLINFYNSKEELNNAEYILTKDVVGIDNKCLNYVYGGGQPDGATPELRELISERTKLAMNNEVTKEKLRNSLKRYYSNIPKEERQTMMAHLQDCKTEESENRRKESLKKVIHTPEWNQKVGNAQRGKKKPWHPDTVRKPVGEETKQKLREINLGKKYSEETKAKKRLSAHKKPVRCYDTNGNIIGQWESIKAASISLNKSFSGVSQACNGKQKTCAGYFWEFVNQNEE